jgi:hypothetical protein
MARTGEPDTVKLLLAILWKDEDALEEALRRARCLWGDVDFAGPDRPFELTDYYEEEMGSSLQRRLISFRALVSPDALVECKLSAMDVEAALHGATGRRVNLDIGYLDVHKVVLASIKYGGQKIYLGRGVYADMACRYSKGQFHSFPWSFPDFRDDRYESDLLAIRTLYKAQLRPLA